MPRLRSYSSELRKENPAAREGARPLCRGLQPIPVLVIATCRGQIRATNIDQDRTFVSTHTHLCSFLQRRLRL